MKNNKLRIIVILIMFLFFGFTGYAVHYSATEIETGLAWSGYNNIRIPGEGGTEFSFSEDLKTKEATPTRIRFMIDLGMKSFLILTYAPLKLEASGILGKDLFFNDRIFSAGLKVKGTYKFNSYRITYAYNWKQEEKFNLSIGLTAKVRDAAIIITDPNGISSEKTNTGFVPLIYFRYEYLFNENFGLLCEGDALAAPQGRAEDIFLGLNIRKLGLKAPISIRFGYRILEGGADNKEVYNFTLINYFVFGILF